MLFYQLPGSPSPWCSGGPVGPRNTIVICTWWLLRETEAANARAIHADLFVNTDSPPATALLPVSKTAPQASGTARAHHCMCRGGASRVDCPTHALGTHILLLKKLFPTKFVDGACREFSPVVPDVSGKAAG